MIKSIVTGANGYIGQRLIKKIVDDGEFVFAIVRDTNEKIPSFFKDNKLIKIIYCDLNDLDSLVEKIEDRDIDFFYHLGWSGVSSNFKNCFDLQFKNIAFTYNAIEIANLLNCKKFIGFGSSSECSLSNSEIFGTECPSPTDLYAAAKASSRFFCYQYASTHDINFNWCLITSVYGPGRDDNNLIHYTITSLLDNKKPSFTKLEQKWDYIYIDDLINAIILVAKKGKNFKVYPIGSGDNKKMYDYVKIISSLINPNIPLGIGELPYKTGKVDNSIINIKSLKDDTGFIPRFSFEEGIKIVINYYKGINKI
jgi:Nucleoside-diphosphate-sugar epimerases